VLLLVLAAACSAGSRTPTHPVGPSAPLVPVATAAGDPVSVGTTVTVPSTGGALAATDGGLWLSLPPTALGTTTPITVTPINNTARGAIGPAYRLGPEGTTFAVPVTLTFKAPVTYPVGTSIAGVGVEYQDAAGYWHTVEPVTRDLAGHTVSVTTTHFSDWALTWQGGTAAADGPISLDQSVGTPLTATGTATLFFLSDDPYDTSYGLTATLTLQPVGATYVVDGATCVPVQRTVTTLQNVANAHKRAPPEFQWGLGANWSVTCDDGKTRVLPAIFDTMGINPPMCPGDYSAGQIVSSDQLAGTFVKDCGLSGTVSATWDLRSCWQTDPSTGLPTACSTGVDCRLGTLDCSGGGAGTCVDAGPAPDPTPCGTALAGTCTSGVCVMP
jgi:hypothetical protein